MRGKTNNPNGRPAGTPNKITLNLRERISNFLSDNWQEIETDFSQLEPKERLIYFEKLLAYSIPKNTVFENEVNPEPIVFKTTLNYTLDASKIPHEDLKELIKKNISTDNEVILQIDAKDSLKDRLFLHKYNS